jgi:exodeoxyribonuclease VII small subunit
MMMEEKDMQTCDVTSPAPTEDETPRVKRTAAKRKKTSDSSPKTPETAAAGAEAKAAALPFEAAATRLEEIVQALEGGTLSLEESLSLYEEGVALVRRCTEELNQAKQRVMALRRRTDGTVEAAAFPASADAP